jgi:RNA polymerase sigma-70 factor (ECF subfamily)
LVVLWVLALFAKKKAGADRPLDQLEDEELMLRYGGGDVAAFEELLRRHERAVFNFIARYVGDRTQAEDIVQEVFLRVIRTSGRYKAKAKFTTWLFTIARNLCIDRARQRKRRPEVSLDRSLSDDDDSGATFADRLVDEDASDATGQSIRGEFRAKLNVALGELPDEQREVFAMREFGGLKFREIAETLDISENTVKSRMRYAIQTLSGHLAEYRDFSFDHEEERERSPG